MADQWLNAPATCPAAAYYIHSPRQLATEAAQLIIFSVLARHFFFAEAGLQSGMVFKLVTGKKFESGVI